MAACHLGEQPSGFAQIREEVAVAGVAHTTPKILGNPHLQRGY